MVSINAYRPADYAVLGTAGAVTLAAGLTALYALPWRCCRWQRYEPFNTFWRGKVLLEIILGCWAALQILRLALLWGPYSIVAPSSVTDWTGAGWLCRIYITAALGVTAPLSAWFFLFLLAAGKSDTERSTLSLANKYYNYNASSSQQHIVQHPYPPMNRSYSHSQSHSQSQSHSGHMTMFRDIQDVNISRTNGNSNANFNVTGTGTALGGIGGTSGFRTDRDSGSGTGLASGSNPTSIHWKVGRALFFALLCTLPTTLLQTAAAWVSEFVDSEGKEIEEQPRTLIGYFLAVFWYGTPAECNSTSTSTSTNTQECTVCTFSASSAIIHLLWTLIFLFCLWTTAARISAAALNRALQKRLRLLIILYTTFAGIGCACLGVSVVEGPFSWINQGVWLGYVATVAATALLLSWEVVIVPVHSSHVAARRALEWGEGDPSGQLTYAQAVVAAPDFPPYSYPYPTSSQQQLQQGQGQQQQEFEMDTMFVLSNNANSYEGGGYANGIDTGEATSTTGNESLNDGIGGGGGGGGGGSDTNFGAAAPLYSTQLPPFPNFSPPAPYCQIELASQPPSSARKPISRLFPRSSRASSRIDSDDGDENLISARDVLVETPISNTPTPTSISSGGGGITSGVQMLPSPFMTPVNTRPSQQQQQQQQQMQYYNNSRAESPGGTGGTSGGTGSTIPALYNRYYRGSGGVPNCVGSTLQGHPLALRPSSAASSTAGSVGSVGILSGSQGRTSWPLNGGPAGTGVGTGVVGTGTTSVAAAHLASYYQPHWQQQQQQQHQRGFSASAAAGGGGGGSRPSTASSSAPPTTVSPVVHVYGGTAGAGGRGSSQPYYSSSLAGGGLGLGLFGLHGLGGGSARHYHHASSFGRGHEAVPGTPTSSGTATPTPQSKQKAFPPPWQ